MPTPDDFRALARSSPWLFRRAHLTWRPTGEHWPPVEGWLERPGVLRYRWGDEAVQEVRDEPRAAAAYSTRPTRDRWWHWWGRRTGPRRRPGTVTLTWVGEVEPVRRPDGLVARRPEGPFLHADDPMAQTYRWVSMLDPYELAAGVDLTDVREMEHRGRVSWAARAVAGGDYDPRCACCPLLWCEVADRYEAEGGGPALSPDTVYPAAYDVVLDRATGIVVSLRPVGTSDRDDLAFETEIHSTA